MLRRECVAPLLPIYMPLLPLAAAAAAPAIADALIIYAMPLPLAELDFFAITLIAFATLPLRFHYARFNKEVTRYADTSPPDAVV